MPRLFNKKFHKNIPSDAIYIGRPSKWGNPFVINRDGSRTEVIEKYEQYLMTNSLKLDLSELRGKDLVCYCAPSPCHGDVLLRLANPKKNVLDV